MASRNNIRKAFSAFPGHSKVENLQSLLEKLLGSQVKAGKDLSIPNLIAVLAPWLLKPLFSLAVLVGPNPAGLSKQDSMT